MTVTLPGEQVAIIEAMVADGEAKSVSAWIAAAVAERLTAQGLTPTEHSRRR